MNKKSVIISVLAVVIMIFAFGIFETEKEKKEVENAYCIVADSENTTVVIKKKPEKVAVLFSSLCELWQTAGGETAITVGESVERGFVSKKDVALVDSGAGKSISAERLLFNEPDLVILSADIPSQQKAVKVLRSSGIPVLVLRLDNFEDYLYCLDILTEITGKKENLSLYGEKLKGEIEEIKKANQKEGTFLFVRSGASPSSAKAKKGEENFAAKIIEDFGLKNIAYDAPELLDTLSTEKILKENPDYIFVSIMGDERSSEKYISEYFEREEFSALKAVKEKKIYFLPKELFHFKPCGRWGESYKYISDILK